LLRATFIEGLSAVSTFDERDGYSINKFMKGTIRFVEIPDGCVIDGTVKGFCSGEHGMHIHEYGDLSDGCNR